jgi:hypothetical protein
MSRGKKDVERPMIYQSVRSKRKERRYPTSELPWDVNEGYNDISFPWE